ncbi:DUF2312 domain-containing protein [Nisaea sediminum]|uniref:DUF2312 domain-containing protein n=1 Tax=Nisaea sediminum TaxID=2775867 RepID=UPI0029C0ACCA|nr:DUF2312 domain-containing protein [Nisaea sediminum]
MTIGHNTVAADQLRSYVERIERLIEEKEAIAADIKDVYAEAKGNGFAPNIIKAVVKIRKMKPEDRKEAEGLLATYLHALGMESNLPLFKFAGLASIDTAVREQVIEAMKDLVPPFEAGDITVNMGGKPFRLWRDKDQAVQVEEVAPRPVRDDPAPTPSVRRKKDVPDVDDSGAFELGKEYARGNRPVIDNPFPAGDSRRGKFDEGWRAETGSDGMGPDGGE